MTEDHVQELIKKYADNTASPQEVEDLMNWYRSAPLSEVPWPASTPGEKELVYNRLLQRLRTGTAPVVKTRNTAWMRVAALFVLLIGIAYTVFYFTNGGSGTYITIFNPSGQIKELTLPDGSKVWINAASELQYAKGFKKERDLMLKGEAYFDVTPDPAHPFRIRAGGVTTTVLGTAFNIKAYEEGRETIVSVVHGRVQVDDSSRTLGVVLPSMQLTFQRGLKSAVIRKTDTESAVAWKEGRLQFEGAPLGDIGTALGHWYGVNIQFTDPAVKDCRYYMGFNNKTPLTDLLSSVAELTGMSYTIDKEKKTVLFSGKGCN